MKVKVSFDGDLKERLGSNGITIPIEEGETVDVLLIKLGRRNPELVDSILDPRTGDLSKDFEIDLNGRPIRGIKGIHTRLKDKDEISISKV